MTRTNEPMVIIRAKGSTRQLPRKCFFGGAAYNTVQKQTVLTFQEMKRETMMIIKKNKVKLANEDANTRRNPNSTSGIYLTDIKVAQCRHVSAKKREIEQEKKIIAKKTTTRKVHLQLKRSRDFDMCINSMKSLSSSTTYEDRFIKIIQQSSNTINDDFVQIGGKLSKLPNQGGDTVAREMIRIMK